MQATSSNPLLESAQRLAERGWQVFPLQPGTKVPFDGSHGHKDATTDRDKIEAWWTEHPTANIGVRTGEASGIVVLDIDGEDGFDSLAELERKHGPLPDTLSVKTPQGAHHYFACPANVTVRNSAGKIAAGIDTRGEGGYAVAPPSHTNDGEYVWDTNADLTPMPEWLADLLRKPPPVAATSSAGEAIPVGCRNDTLARGAGTMRRSGFCEDSIAGALLSENAKRCKPPLEESEVRKIAHSVSRYDPAATAATVDDLTALLGLTDKRIDTIKVFGRGTKGTAYIGSDNAERIVLNPLGAFSTPGKLAQELALQVGAKPTLGTGDVLKIMGLLYALGDHAEQHQDENRAWDLGVAFLRAKPTISVCMADQASRWEAFSELEHLPEQTPIAILEDPETGLRYVRAHWFQAFIRDSVGPGESRLVMTTMTHLGWTTPGREGRIKATRPGLKGELQWSFFVVPKGWEDE